MAHLSYLDFLRNAEVQQGLQLIANSKSMFMRDLERIETRVRPLFLKLMFKEEGNELPYTKTWRQDRREENISEYQTRLIIAQWIQDTWKFRYATSAIPAKLWKTTIPKYFDPRSEVLVFPEGDIYSMITFDCENIIDEELKKSKDEIYKDLTERKKKGHINKGRFNLDRVKNLNNNEMVFFVSPSIITIPCLNKDSFVYLRQQIFANIPSTDII